MRTESGTDCTEMLQNLNRNLLIVPCVRWGERAGRAGEPGDRSCRSFRELDCVLTEQGIRPHSPHPTICNRGIYFLSRLSLLIRLCDLGSETKACTHSSRRRPCLPQRVSFYLMTCNGWSQGWNLSTTNVLFLIRPARGAGAQLHHSTWERGTGSSGVQRPAWSTSSHPVRAAEDPVSEGLELLKRAPPTAAACDTPQGRFKKKTFRDSAVNFSSMFVTNGKNIILSSFPLKITCSIITRFIP